MPTDDMAVHFRDHQRHIRLHPPDCTVVDHHCPCPNCNWGVLPADFLTGRKQGDVHTAEGLPVQQTHSDALASKYKIISFRNRPTSPKTGDTRTLTVNEDGHHLVA